MGSFEPMDFWKPLLFTEERVQGVLAYHVFWGKQKTVIDKIRDKQGLAYSKPKMGGNYF